MTDQKKEKMLIVVSGGVVQSIFSSNGDVQVDLLDFDNEVFPDDESAKRAFEMMKKGLTEIGFWRDFRSWRHGDFSIRQT